MRFAYADPPYLGCGARLYGKTHPDAAAWDDPATHRQLVARLVAEFPDGWALSLHTPSLMTYCRFPEMPEDVRFSAWVKPFASFKPGVNPAYAWEPIIWRGGRKMGRDVPTVRDWVSANITMQRGLAGAKPDTFATWLYHLLGAQPEDEMVDVFPGTGAVSRAWADASALTLRNEA